MHRLLLGDRDEPIARCKAKVAVRPARDATDRQLSDGVPMFLDQLIRTLGAEGKDDAQRSLEISGPTVGDSNVLSEMGLSATAQGK